MDNVLKKQNAYFTVEAALVLPFVTGALIFTVFVFIYQYDRCLLEQDMNLLAVLGGTTAADSGRELEDSIQKRLSALDMEKYAAWEMNALQVTVKGDKVCVTGGGTLKFPLPEWNFFGTENLWEARVYRETRRISPVDYIRLYRRLKGGE